MSDKKETMMKTFLEDEILRLRALEPDDLEDLYRWENDSTLWQYGDTLSPYSKYALKLYISRATQQNFYDMKQLRFIIEEKTSGQSAGTMDLFDFDPFHNRAGIGILLDKAFQKKGYALRSLHLLIDYAFHFLDLHQLYVHIFTDNESCLKLFEQTGFTPCGLIRDWYKKGDSYADVAMYQLIAP